MKITVIIPTHNEEEGIKLLLDTLLPEITNINQHSFNILIVDGKSTDGTVGVVKEKIKVYNNIYLLCEKEKKGLGAAYLLGMNYAIDALNSDAFIEFDGDFQHNPTDIIKLVNKLNEGYDYVIGSRYIDGGTIPHEWPWHRKFLSRFGNIVIRTILKLPINDATSGFKLTRVKGFKNKLPLRKGELISLRHAYKIHFLHSMIKNGAKTIEVPITFLNRNKGVSKSTLEDITESLRVVWELKKIS